MTLKPLFLAFGALLFILFGAWAGEVRADDVHPWVANWPERPAGPVNAKDTNKMMAVQRYAIESQGYTFVYVTGQIPIDGQGSMLATWKYDTDGNLVAGWPKTWAGPGLSSKAQGTVVIDDHTGTGGVYVGGSFTAPGQGLDTVLIHYNAAGNYFNANWPKTFNGTGNGDDYPVNLDVDDFGTLWVGVVTFGSGTGADYLIWGIDSTGAVNLAMTTFDYAHKGDVLVDIKVYSIVQLDPQGQVIVGVAGIAVTGTSYGGITGDDVQTLEYRYNYMVPSFTQTYSVRYNMPGSDTATSLALIPPTNSSEPHASLYVSAHTTSHSNNGTTDIVLLGYVSDNHATNWPRYINGTANGNDYSIKVTIGTPRFGYSLDQIYITGSALMSFTGYDAVTMAYNPDGFNIWGQERFTGLAGDDFAVDLATNGGGDVYVLEVARGSTSDYRTFKLNSVDGSDGWEQTHAINYDTGGADVPGALRLDPSANAPRLADIYVTGRSAGPAELSVKYATLRYFQTY